MSPLVLYPPALQSQSETSTTNATYIQVEAISRLTRGYRQEAQPRGSSAMVLIEGHFYNIPLRVYTVKQAVTPLGSRSDMAGDIEEPART